MNLDDKASVGTGVGPTVKCTRCQDVHWVCENHPDKPWNAEHAAGRITRPLRFNGIPYRGINVLMLWASAMNQNFATPIWMTFNQAKDLKANVRKGSKGSLVVYADRMTKTETAEFDRP